MKFHIIILRSGVGDGDLLADTKIYTKAQGRTQ